MLPLFVQFAILLISIAVLVKSANYFTDSAEKIGLYFGIPSFIIGITIVSVGTSLPELFTSIEAVMNNNSQIVIGDVVGSNIANILLVLGLSFVISKNLQLTYDITKVDIPMLAASAFFLFICSINMQFTFLDGILSILALFIYILYALLSEKNEFIKLKDKKTYTKISIKVPLMLIISAVAIDFSSKYAVLSIINISKLLNIGTEIIAASVVAIGTSLPELSVSISAARKGNIEISVGNIVGSNIFNTFGVMGIASLFGTLTITKDMLYMGIPVMIFATLMFIFSIQKKTITRWEGWMFIVFYLLFLAKLFNLD